MHQSNNWSSNFFLDLGEVGAVGLDISNCRGQGHDGASNMSAQALGEQGLIAQKKPKALYVHCNSHVLNLVIVKACSLPSVRNMAGTITEISQFFNYSPKRQRCLEKVISVDQPDSQRTKIRDPCRTRWVERHEAYETRSYFGRTAAQTIQYRNPLELGQRDSPEGKWLLPHMLFFPVSHRVNSHHENFGSH